MSDKVFLDTNVLVYLYSGDDTDKQQAMCRTLDNYYCVTSVQVLNGISNVWYKKLGWDGQQIKNHLDNIEEVCNEIYVINRSTINQALEVKDRYGYTYYDSLILASALENGCHSVMTEDMNHGQNINGMLTVTNPFL